MVAVTVDDETWVGDVVAENQCVPCLACYVIDQ